MTRKTHAKVIRENDQAITPAQAKRAAELFARQLYVIKAAVFLSGSSVVIPGLGVFYPKKFKSRSVQKMTSTSVGLRDGGTRYVIPPIVHLAFRPFKSCKVRRP